MGSNEWWVGPKAVVDIDVVLCITFSKYTPDVRFYFFIPFPASGGAEFKVG